VSVERTHFASHLSPTAHLEPLRGGSSCPPTAGVEGDMGLKDLQRWALPDVRFLARIPLVVTAEVGP
jgi:hypothetical protein